MRKRTAETGLFLPLPFFNFSIYYHAKPHIITETHIQTRKLHAVSVFVSYPPFFDSIFRQANTPFSQNRQYPTPFYLSVLYYHGNPGLLRESILLPDSTIFSPIAILSAASKNKKIGTHHPPWWTPPSLKTLDFKPFFNTFACEYPKSYGIISELPPVPLLDFDDFYPSLPHLPHSIRHSTKSISFSATKSHQSSLKSCTSSCDSSASDAVCLVSNCEKRFSR